MVVRWPQIRSEGLHDHGIFKIRRDESRSPRTDRVHRFHILEMPDWVNVIPLTPDGNVVMVRQYRHGSREVSIEIPGGIVDGDDESKATAAARELEEETGYTARGIVSLGTVAPNRAIQGNHLSCFLATGAERRGRQVLDAGEDIEVVEISLNEIPDLIKSQQLSHALVIAAFHLLEIYRVEHPESFAF